MMFCMGIVWVLCAAVWVLYGVPYRCHTSSMCFPISSVWCSIQAQYVFHVFLYEFHMVLCVDSIHILCTSIWKSIWCSAQIPYRSHVLYFLYDFYVVFMRALFEFCVLLYEFHMVFHTDTIQVMCTPLWVPYDVPYGYHRGSMYLRNSSIW